MTRLCFVDTETTSLDAEMGEIWEVAVIVRDEEDQPGEETEYRWLLSVNLTHADPIALSIGGFHRRHPQGNDYSPDYLGLAGLHEFACDLAITTHEAHLVGNVISFDEERLRRLLRRTGIIPSWHYHLVDVEALVAGMLGLPPPWDSRDLCERIGVDMPTEDERHTALGDARWAMRTYDAVMRPR